MQPSYNNLQTALRLAVQLLEPYEPGDSRAVSDEFVALAALVSGDDCIAVMQIINDALRK